MIWILTTVLILLQLKNSSQSLCCALIDGLVSLKSLPVLGCCSVHELGRVWLSCLVSKLFDADLKWLMSIQPQAMIHHVCGFPLSVCLRIGVWCQYFKFGFLGPNWFDQITNQEQLCGFWKRVSLSGFHPSGSLITVSLSTNTYNKGSWCEDWTFEEIIDHSSKFAYVCNGEQILLVFTSGPFYHGSESVEFCETEDCFLTHSIPIRFWILKISHKNRSLETILICIVLQCYPQNNVVCIHMYDEYMQSIDAGVCHRLWSILWWIVRAYLLTIEYRVVQLAPSISISEQFESIHVTILTRISILLLWSGGHRCME